LGWVGQSTNRGDGGLYMGLDGVFGCVLGLGEGLGEMGVLKIKKTFKLEWIF